MKSNIRILDKTKKCNRRCSSCQHWISFKDSTIGNPKNYCSNPNSIHYNQLRDYWHVCKEFNWAENIIDKNDLKCSYCLILPDDSDVYCNYYSYVDRKDMKLWAHFPRCIDKNCPVKHRELLQNESPIKLKDEV